MVADNEHLMQQMIFSLALLGAYCNEHFCPMFALLWLLKLCEDLLDRWIFQIAGSSFEA